MRILQAKSVGQRTPEQMAKAAMKQQALKELQSATLDTQAKVTIEYMGVRHTLSANPTVNVKNGQIMFHFGAVGANRLPFESIGEAGSPCEDLSFGVGGNIMTGLEIEGWNALREKYGLEPITTEPSDDDLDAGETV